jgi:hypothetical protein
VLDPDYNVNPLVPCYSFESFPNEQDFLGSCNDWYNSGAPVYQGASADGGAAQADGTTCANDGECSLSNCVSTDGQKLLLR